MTRHPHVGRLTALAGLLALGIGFAVPAGAAPAGNPGGGNQGTVKIDGYAVDSTPGNEPHVGCTFGVDFYNYEANLDVEMVFEAQPPTGTDQLLVVTGTLDGDDATGADEEGWDGHFAIDLSEALEAYEPQPVQGYHVKLTVHAYDGAGNEADVKHKVFWVGPCVPPETTTTTSTTEPEESTTAPEETTTTAAETTTTTTEAGVLPTSATQTTPPTEVAGEQLPRTGFSNAMLALGTVLLAGGAAMELVARAERKRLAA